MASRQPGHVWGTDLQEGDLGLDVGYLFFFIEQKMFWSKGIQDELIRNKDYIFCPACSGSLMNFMLMGRVI